MNDSFKPAAPVSGEFVLTMNEAEYFALASVVAKTCSDLSGTLAALNLKASDGDLTNAQIQRHAAIRLTESVLRSIQVKLREAQ